MADHQSSSVKSAPEKKDALTQEPLWTVDDAAAYLQLNVETVRNMARTGKLPAFKIGRVWRFHRIDIVRSIRKQV